MSSKRPRPLDDPPAASSSEEEEEEEEEEVSEEETDDEEDPKEEEQQQPKQHPTQSKPKSPESEHDEEEDESEESQGGDEQDDDETEDETVVHASTPIKKLKNPQPQSQSPSPSGDSDSQKSPRASDFTIKPIAPTKQLPETPVSKPHKRRAESSAPDNGKASRPKKDENVGTAVAASAEKKSAVIRLWSEEDEIVILKGLIEFQSKFGKDPSANQGEFHDFIKQSLHVDVSKTQLMDKVRRLKKKFKTNMEKSTDGEDPVLSQPHEYKSFHLSKKIWGNLSEMGSNANCVEDNNASNGGIIEKSSGVRSTKKSRVGDKVAFSNDVDSAGGNKDLEKRKGEKGELTHVKDMDFMKNYPFLMSAIPSGNTLNGLSGLNAVKSNLRLMGSSELRKLDDKWKELNMAETKIALRKFDLMQTQTSSLLDAMEAAQR